MVSYINGITKDDWISLQFGTKSAVYCLSSTETVSHHQSLIIQGRIMCKILITISYNSCKQLNYVLKSMKAIKSMKAVDLHMPYA